MKTVREIAILDRLWELLGRMASEMGSEREALVNQAIHALARQHGFLHPGDPATATTLEAGGPGGREASARRVLETARELERAITPPALPAAPGAGQALWLVGDRGPLARVDGDRFLIGRGKHCDLMIDSAKVSREHAVIRREGDGWWIEDLGSSNGTWHERARIERRRIEPGDEYFICAERIRCVISSSSP